VARTTAAAAEAILSDDARAAKLSQVEQREAEAEALTLLYLSCHQFCLSAADEIIIFMSRLCSNSRKC
jgi:hypothetical protein